MFHATELFRSRRAFVPDRTMPVSDPAVSRPRLIRDARFLEAGRREIALRQGSHTGETGTALLEAGADPNARDNDGKLLSCCRGWCGAGR